MNKYFLSFLILLSVSGLGAQQMPMFTQYMHNPYVLNPAAGGATINTKAMIGYRNQWTGFDGAPKTFYFSMDGALGPVKNRSIRTSRSGRGQARSIGSYHGVGGYIFKDKTGPISHSGLYLSYAYHLEINAGVHVSLGAFLGGLQYSLNTDEIRLANNSNDLDNALGTGTQTQFMPDASLGVYLHTKQYFLGITARQILQTKFKFNDLLQDKYSKLVNHIYFTAGYNFNLDRKWTLQPSTLVKYSQPAEIQVDINLKAIYEEMLWGGFSYRTNESIAALLGLYIQESFSVGYSYDFGIKEIGRLHSGSHEIVLGYLFDQSSSRVRKRKR